MIFYIILFGFTIFIYFYINGFEACRSEKNSENNKSEEKIMEESAKSAVITSKVVNNAKNPTITKEFTGFDSADVVTKIGPQNVCIGVFKNPVDHKTHFYRTRLKGKCFKIKLSAKTRNSLSSIEYFVKSIL